MMTLGQQLALLRELLQHFERPTQVGTVNCYNKIKDEIAKLEALQVSRLEACKGNANGYHV